MNHAMEIDVSKLVPLKDKDIIRKGDVVMDDFGNPSFLVGDCHNRRGTNYCEFFDMPIMRLDMLIPRFNPGIISTVRHY